MTNLPTRSYFTWKLCKGDRYYTPQADPRKYEHPFDYLFDSRDEALNALSDFDVLEDATDQEWVLVKVTYTQVSTKEDTPPDVRYVLMGDIPMVLETPVVLGVYRDEVSAENAGRQWVDRCESENVSGRYVVRCVEHH